MTSTDVHDFVQAADRNMRQVVALAAVQQDLAGRQLSTLRNTYPAWDIDRERDACGQVCWTARLRERVTVRMVTTGVMQSVRQGDAIGLAAMLAWQSALLHNARSNTGPL